MEPLLSVSLSLNRGQQRRYERCLRGRRGFPADVPTDSPGWYNLGLFGHTNLARRGACLLQSCRKCTANPACQLENGWGYLACTTGSLISKRAVRGQIFRAIWPCVLVFENNRMHDSLNKEGRMRHCLQPHRTRISPSRDV